MELAFIKTNTGSWVAEFEATADFNLHIERDGTGPIRVYQRTSAEGDFAAVNEFGVDNDRRTVLDVDFTGVIYPKTIKVESETEPAMALVTFKA